MGTTGSDSDMFTLGYPFRPWKSSRMIVHGDAIRHHLNRLHDSGMRQCTPVNDDPDVGSEPLLDLRSGSIQRAQATVLVGTHDLLTPRRSARALVAAWPGATMRVLPGAGHMLPIERPDDIVEAIQRALAPGRT